MRIEFDSFWIEIETDHEGSGRISSNLKEPPFEDDDDAAYDEYCAAIDAVESLILSHACAGLDVGSEKYVNGIRTTLEAIGNNF